MKKQLFFTLLFSLFFSISHIHFNIGKLFSGGNLTYTKSTRFFSSNPIAEYKITDKSSVSIEYSSGVTELNIFGLNSYLAKDYYKFTKSN